MKNIKVSIFIVFGLLLIAAALFLTAYNLQTDQRAGLASQEALQQLLQQAALEASRNEGIGDGLSETAEVPEFTSEEQEIPDYLLDPTMDMPVENVDGIDYIGVLSIPALELELPICSQWNYKSLKTAPCRYSGSAYMGDMVICAHNFRRHFGGLKNLHTGDEVIFTDVDGNEFRYQVAALDLLAPTDIEGMTSGDWALTLFTCTPGGQSRVTLRCDLSVAADGAG